MSFYPAGGATAAPTDTTQYYDQGYVVWNTSPDAGEPLGFICVVAGYPGTWVPIGQVNQPNSRTVTATSGTLTAGDSMILLNAASGPTLSLPDVRSYAAGTSVFIKQLANNSATLAPISANGYADAAAITLTQYGAITLRSSGGTTWYKQA